MEGGGLLVLLRGAWLEEGWVNLGVGYISALPLPVLGAC